MIPAEAVEAAARELYVRDGYNPWELEEESVRQRYLRKVSYILEAAAPHMLAVQAAAVEAAAIAESERDRPGMWEHESEQFKDAIRRDARLHLEAAAAWRKK